MKLRSTLILALALLIIPFNDAAARRIKYTGTGIVAHRGFWNCEEAGYAKNSIAALRCAQEAGVWGSEFDVNMTADSVLLVFHDSTVEGKKIEKHNHADFKYFRLKNGEPIPTLEEYLEQAKQSPETMLVYELKCHSCPEVEETAVLLTIEKLKESGLLDPSRVMFISFSKYICERLSQLIPDFDVLYLNGDLKPLEVKKSGIPGIDYHYNVFNNNNGWVKEAQKLDMSVNAWTVNKVENMEQMLNLHVNYLTTDYPLDARALIKEMKGIREIR
jgi:glycerophosphoryl diester phosphodiesterase